MTIEADRQTAALDFRISGKKRSRGGVRKHSTGAPSLLVIEALGILGKRGGGSRVSVNGWALATSKITKLVLSIGTQVSATAFYGVARPDIARLYPARRDAEHCGFILAVDLPIGAAGTVELLLTVHTVDGRIGTGPLRIDIPPQQLTPLILKYTQNGSHIIDNSERLSSPLPSVTHGSGLALGGWGLTSRRGQGQPCRVGGRDKSVIGVK